MPRRLLSRVTVLLTLALFLTTSASLTHAAPAATYTVNSTADTNSTACMGSGTCTLRGAINLSNSVTGPSVINFNIAGSPPFTINVTSSLPAVTKPVTIDGASQPGYAGVPIIELNGAAAGAGVNGLLIAADGVTVKGLVINRFTANGILIHATNNTVIQGNYIGTDVAGATAQGNGSNGVGAQSNARNVLIGGTASGQGNLISANRADGILFYQAGSGTVQGNRVGTNAAGTAALGNGQAGVSLNDTPNVVIGGTVTGARNLVSGNVHDGVYMVGGLTTNTVIQGNYIGTNASGNAALPNGDNGVTITANHPGAVGAPSNTLIGGTTTGARNIISGNHSDGVTLVGPNMTDTRVQGNYIGTDAAGAVAVANGTRGVAADNAQRTTVGGTDAGAGNLIGGNLGPGVHYKSTSDGVVQGNLIGTNASGTALRNNSSGVYIEASSNIVVGGVAAGAANTIAFNNGHGVAVGASNADTSLNNPVRGNAIYSNAYMGINLSLSDNVTANDALDADSGPNGLQNFPVLTSAALGAGGLAVQGTLDSNPNTTFSIDIYANSSCDTLIGNGEGQIYVGTITSVTTNSSGHATFSATLPTTIPSGYVATATATSAANNTSEFSTCQAITGSGGGGRAVSDFDGDGKSDILWRNLTSGQNIAWLMNGSTITNGLTLPTVGDVNWKIIGLGDLNGDGKADLVWQNFLGGQISVWLMNGATISGAGALPTITDPNWKLVGVGDLDGDGKDDLVWRHATGGQNVAWFMNGVSITNSAVLPPVADPIWKVVAVGDLNGDGNDDLVWRNFQSGQNIVWFMAGASISGSAVLTAVTDPNWLVAGSGDFNADGKADLVWRNQAGGQNAVWLMNGGSILSAAVLATIADPNWQIVSTGDLNGDGKADLTWRHLTSGVNSVWFMDGGTPSSYAALPSVPSDWRVVSPTTLTMSANGFLPGPTKMEQTEGAATAEPAER